MDLGLTGRVAIVTGGSLGIGRAISIELAREGCKVVVVSRNPANVAGAVEEIRSMGGTAHGVSADCLTKEGIEHAVAIAGEIFGPPDIAVYIPFATIKGYFDECDDDLWDQGDIAMVRGFAWLVRAVAPAMKERHWGRIVTIGAKSTKMLHRDMGAAVPNAYRLAGVGLSKTIADDYGRYGITVNTIGTGSVLTDNFRTFFTDLGREQGKTLADYERERSAAIPVRRLGRPDEVAAACAFLASDVAGFITGQFLLCDGGRVEAPL